MSAPDRRDGSDRYGTDVLAAAATRRAAARVVPEVEADADLVAEELASGWCGAVVAVERTAGMYTVTLEDRRGRRRTFPLAPRGFAVEGVPVTLVRPRQQPSAAARRRTASGSYALEGARARVARASRIWVEGRHDAELVERVWGDDLRVEGVVVEALDGVDGLAAAVAELRPGPGRRLGVLVDHLVPGSKESRLVAAVRDPHVLVTGHPYVDVWQAVRPAAVGIAAWPSVPRGVEWKDGVCTALGVAGGPREMWRRVLAGVDSYADLETPLLGAVERLVDFVTAGADGPAG